VGQKALGQTVEVSEAPNMIDRNGFHQSGWHRPASNIPVRSTASIRIVLAIFVERIAGRHRLLATRVGYTVKKMPTSTLLKGTAMISRRRTQIQVGALLLVAAAIAVCFVLHFRLETANYKAPLGIAIQASYPGANAQTVADTVATPIEEQVNGVEYLLSMSSLSANDGTYVLHLTFKAGTDLDMAQVLVQNRVALAMPVIPALVQRQGISVRKRAPEPLMLVGLTSPDNRFDDLYLSNYAANNVKDELARLPGVGDIILFGQRDSRTRITLDADKLAALQLSAMDVVTAINEQNIQIAQGLGLGQPPVPNSQQFQLTISTQFQLTINTPGRLTEPEQVESIIVKATPDGRIVLLKDVARVEVANNEGCYANLNGKPTALLSIHPLPNAKPSAVSRAVLDKLAELRTNVPDGLALAVAFDFATNLEAPNNPATPEHLVIDAQLPDSASAERTARILERASELLRKTSGVQDVLALTEHPFSLVRNRPCLVVRLTPKDQREFDREQLAGKVRGALQDQIPEAVFRLSLPSAAKGFPVYGFPIEFTIEDHGDQGSASLRECAEALVVKMSQSGKFTDVSVGSGLRCGPALNLEIDRTKCQALGVEIDEIFNRLQVYLGSCYVNDFNQFGRTWQMTVQVDPRFRDQTSAIQNLEVKNKENQLVRLGTVLSVRETSGPTVIERHNRYPIARLTANLAPGVPLAEAKSECESLAQQEFGAKQFKLSWYTR
jgi:multidrug efflux pump subunit AcrB